MRGKPIIVIALVIALGAGLVVTGADVLPGNDDAASEPFPTETAAPSAQETTQVASGSGGETTTPAATPTPPFGFAIENIEECGQTCRDVTSTLTNQQDTTAEDVVVYTRIFAGQGTDGDVVWRGDADVGTLGPGQSYTTTRRVELGFQDALAVQNADGWITVQTTVETADRTVTFTEQRQVL